VSDDGEVGATLCRSPIDARCWVPFLPETEVFDSVWAGGIRAVKEAAYERVQTALVGTEPPPKLVWQREDEDTWTLVVYWSGGAG
jgi:hypothetical protein